MEARLRLERFPSSVGLGPGTLDKQVSAFSTELPGPEVIKLFSCSTQLSMKF